MIFIQYSFWVLRESEYKKKIFIKIYSHFPQASTLLLWRKDQANSRFFVCFKDTPQFTKFAIKDIGTKIRRNAQLKMKCNNKGNVTITLKKIIANSNRHRKYVLVSQLNYLSTTIEGLKTLKRPKDQIIPRIY